MRTIISALIGATAMAYNLDAKIPFYQRADSNMRNGLTPIEVEVDGEQKTMYFTIQGVQQGTSDIQVPSNGRGYLAETPDLDMSNPKYWTPNLMGGSVEYDIDLSNHECGCIAAFYTVMMPGKKQDGSPWVETDGWGYCDAMQVGGNYCPEFDIMEANKWSWATTPHSCDSPSNGHYWNCDRGGDGQNIMNKLGWNGYGPGDQYTINTDKSFHVKLDITSSSFTTTLTQEGRTQSFGANDGYVSKMADQISGKMAFVASNWYGDATWLWGNRCQGSCNMPQLNISNLKVKTGGDVPPVGPTEYNFGDACASRTVGQCGDACPSVDHCRWSWAKDDPQKWSGHTADCRCDVNTKAEVHQEFALV